MSNDVVDLNRVRELRLPRQRPSKETRLASIIAVQNDLYTADVDLDAVMRVVADKAQRLTNANGALIEVQEGTELVFKVGIGVAAAFAEAHPRIPINGSLSGIVLSTGEPIMTGNAFADPRANPDAVKALNMRSMLLVPLRHQRVPVGVLKVVSTEADAFTDDDRETLQLMSGLISAAMSRAAEYEAKRALVEERERAAREMEEQHAMLRMFFEAAPVLIAVAQHEGDDFRHIVANPAMARLYDATPQEMVGRTAVQLGIPRPTLNVFLPKLDEAERTGLPIHFDCHAGPGSSRKLAVTIVALPLRASEAHRRFCYLIDDITERSRLRDQLEISERLACVGRLAAGVAHEMNNPLAYASSNVTYVREELDTLGLQDSALKEDVRQALLDAEVGIGRVVKIVSDLQTFVRSGSQSFDGVIDLALVAERCVTLTHNETKHRARVVTELSPTPPVRGNEGQLGQVIVQLLVNAAQAIDDGHPERHVITARAGTQADHRAFVEVEDDGIGMGPEVSRRIFDPFFTTRPVGSAIGLGLTVCRNIVEAHGGELTVRSEAGKGSVFRVTLPAAI